MGDYHYFMLIQSQKYQKVNHMVKKGRDPLFNVDPRTKRILAAILIVAAGMYLVWVPDVIPDILGFQGYIDDFFVFVSTISWAHKWTVRGSGGK